MRLRSLGAALTAFTLIAAACGSEETVAGTEGCDPLPTFADGVLTVATGETVFPPWMGAGDDDFDDPTTGTGFEGALVFALAEELGLGSNVTFVRTGFDEVIAPGAKDWDFNIQQYSITDQRDEVVDFSDGYYQAEEAVIGVSGGSISGVTTIADLKGARLGAPIGTTSLDYIDNVIEPDTTSSAFDDLSAAKAAFDAGQVDGIVVDLPTAFFMVAVEFENAEIVGVLPRSGDGVSDQLGMLFEEGNPLVACVNVALANLRDAGKIDELEDEWLNQGGNIPTLSN